MLCFKGLTYQVILKKDNYYIIQNINRKKTIQLISTLAQKILIKFCNFVILTAISKTTKLIISNI